jgi:hypothetical protein
MPWRPVHHWYATSRHPEHTQCSVVLIAVEYALLQGTGSHTALLTFHRWLSGLHSSLLSALLLSRSTSSQSPDSSHMAWQHNTTHQQQQQQDTAATRHVTAGQLEWGTIAGLKPVSEQNMQLHDCGPLFQSMQQPAHPPQPHLHPPKASTHLKHQPIRYPLLPFWWTV